jgi:dsRNA-specific ribonuclease
MYLDLGLDFTRDFILKHVYSTLSRILEQGLYVDPKSYLQEFTQAQWGYTPTYSLE